MRDRKKVRRERHVCQYRFRKNIWIGVREKNKNYDKNPFGEEIVKMSRKKKNKPARIKLERKTGTLWESAVPSLGFLS